MLAAIRTFVMQIIMRILRFIPRKRNRISFSSRSGEQYSCNPKYISEYLIQNYPNKFEIIWLFDQPEQYEYLSQQAVHPIRRSYFNRIRFGLTSNVNVVNAIGSFNLIPPRRYQINIDTWHGGGRYKLTGLNTKSRNRFADYLRRTDINNTSYFLSTNKYFTDDEIRGDFGYRGDVLNIGFPRNDIFFNSKQDEYKKKICDYFGLDTEKKILMYAPTFRDKQNSIFELPDFHSVKQAASDRFGGEWIVLARAHPTGIFTLNDPDIYDATYKPDMPDMQELLMASDMLISDYSSCIWDFSFTGRPCLLFTPDLDEYTENRGFGIDIYEWGFPVCKTQQELLDTIENFDLESFQLAMQKHYDDLGSFEDGHATEKVCKLIYDHCFGSEEDKK